jgi:hypothetical protein
LGTVSATANEWQSDPIAAMPSGDSLAHGLDDARQLVPGNMRKFDVRVVPLPAVPVA